MQKQKWFNRNLIAVVLFVIAFSVLGFSISFDSSTQPENSLASQNKQHPHSPALKAFDTAVGQSRVEMRKYCGLTKQLLKSSSPDADKQKLALEHLRKTKALWVNVLQKFEDNPPPEYARDDQFETRLADILSNMQEMERYLKEGEAKKSFYTCSYTCGLLVEMHEENGLIYPLDRLYHLRKVAKTMVAAGQIGELEAVRSFVPELLHQRDRVLLASCVAPEDTVRCQQYQTLVKAMSTTVDEVAIDLAVGNQKVVMDVLNDLLPKINKAYDLLLR